MSAKDVLMRYATPLTTWLFLISLVSGIALFLGVGNQYFREMHEILSMFLIVPFGLHVWRNWRTLLSYFRRSAMWVSTVVCLVAAGAFAYEGAGASAGGNPRMAAFGALNNASMTALAALARTDEATVTARLKTIGVDVTSAEDTVASLAKASGRDSFDLLGAALTSASPVGQPAP
ncbi:DUF4405 domain-containing protein [Pleomorphomonas sp. PLEO]|uniref:DUF4405 domain-containing protein n=1 Tax=Pleomorphomonas sp. PLEO TaxID=3239306 RepID=UPI00351DFDC1